MGIRTKDKIPSQGLLGVKVQICRLGGEKSSGKEWRTYYAAFAVGSVGDENVVGA